MRKLLFLLAFPALLHVAYAQKHDNYWIFGYDYDTPSNNNGTLLHFEKGYPAFTLENLKYDFGLYCAICSDTIGNLLFHTNGRQIRNRLHNVMENGNNINPGQIWSDYPNDYPSITGGLTIPAPGFPNYYYLIHTSLSNDYNPDILCPILYSSLIDMNANGGLGKVVEKNKVMAEGDLPSPVLVKHGNGRDWWLIVGDYISKTYMIFLVNPQGINLVHQQNIAPPSLTNQSYAKASPDGRIFVNNDDHTGLWLFDFDRCSGLLSHPRVIPYQPPVFWTSTNAFSNDGRFFYAGTHLVILQLDLQTIDDPFVVIDTIGRYEYGASPAPSFYTHFSLPELSPDQRIYYTTFNNSKAFHVINRPNLPLLASDFAQRGLILPKHNGDTRCYFPNYRLGKWLDSPCDTLAFAPDPDHRFQDTQWTKPELETSTEAIKILKLPPGFYIPPSDGAAVGDDYNPLNMKTIAKRAKAERRKKAAESQKIGHE